MIPALLAQIGLPLLTRLLSDGLGTVDHPAAKAAAGALKEVRAAIDGGAIPPEAVAEANRHVERLAELDSAETRTALQEINASLRAEAASDDAYVRRMRPTFGYVMALTWCTQMGAVAWSIVAEPAQAGAVIEAMGSLSTIWTVGLSVLGIYVYKRSEEKRSASGALPGGPLAALVQRLARRS
ncbi:3TM-type holin [Azospirillum sp. ST 5-10]|uniref:3TM-type holin n=1 Tax=unclassified Azospirillum TaxID=2630922 RepID=UPI003F49B755